MSKYTTESVIAFAREELQKYLQLLDISANLTLGLFHDFGLQADVRDPVLDDAIAISVKDRKGYIAGCNGRSVLMGVYRLLEQWGIRWVRPGPNGTYIPAAATVCDVQLLERPEKRHRTMCIEGAVSIENVLDMIEWLPKVGFNGYYIQFSDAFIFFDRWYSHRQSPVKEPEPFSYEKAREYVERMTDEIKKRGMLLQRMGHGWNCDPFGVENHGWDPVDPATVPQEYLDLCAMINGERKLWMNQPISTQLCYSNPKVRKTMVEGVLNYVKEHPEADFIHFWLGDYFNNTCECPNCTERVYSDFLVMMLNDITDELVRQGLSTQLGFINGYNASWPPGKERIRNTERTTLTFAPISRTFCESFPEGFQQKEIPPYELNNFDLPRSVDENLAYLYQWEQCYDGDVMNFDYYLMWDHILDAGGEGIARVIHQDIRNFKSLGVSSFISCQLQRNAFPTSIAMTTMAKTLWNSAVEFDSIRRDLYAAAFGEDAADALCEYFGTLSAGFDIGAIRSQRPVDRAECKSLLSKALEAMEQFRPVIEAHLQVENPCHRTSWEHLEIHRQIYTILGQSILASMSGDPEAGEALRLQSVRLAWENEDKVQPVLDCLYYEDMTRTRINLDGPMPFVG